MRGTRSARLPRAELLDNAGAAAASRSLADLVRINRYFGGHRTIRSTLRKLFEPVDSFSVLDVGAGSGDSAGAIQSAFPNARVASLDYRLSHLRLASGLRVVASAFLLPFRPKAFDVVFCSLFLHHFDEAQILELLKNFGALARKVVVAVDLERHWFARRFLPATNIFFSWHEITLHDGPVSVESGFLPDELSDLARTAGLREVQVRRHLPWFRLSMSARP